MVAVAAVVAAVCSGEGDGGRQEAIEELMASYRERDYFELRTRLDTLEEMGEPRMALLSAATAQAFNDPARSNRHLDELGPGSAGLPDSLRADAEEVRSRNHMRLHQYARALESLETLLEMPGADSSTLEDAANLVRAMEALADAPPQRVVSRAAARIERRPDGRVPVRIGVADRGYVLDTGANLSTMMRSEADSLGLRIREAGLDVGTSTGSQVRADVTVAPRLQLGEVVLENVVFLVVPDELLTFGEIRIPGILGFPVLEALGEVEFVRGGGLRIPEQVPDRGVHNLALDFLTPLIRVEVLGHDAVCDFDTGANSTSLHRPFYVRHRTQVDRAGPLDTVHFAGAGGERRMPARVLSDVRLAFGDTATTISQLPVYTESVATATEEHPRDCRLGLDALAGFDGYRLNLRSMTFQPL